MAGCPRGSEKARAKAVWFLEGKTGFHPTQHVLTLRPMALHLVKLAVGCESVKDLKARIAERIQTARKKGLPLRHIHVTRMTPKRADELLAGGSLYWVVRGEVAAREKIIAVEPFRDKAGGRRGRLVKPPRAVSVSARPMRPVQGWRHFTDDAAPPGLRKATA